MRRLFIVLGDQLSPEGAWREDLDPAEDLLWMAEVPAESTKVWSHRQRIAVFLSAMRHFAADRRAEGLPLEYTRLEDAGNDATLGSVLAESLRRHDPAEVRVVQPGEWDVEEELRRTVEAAGKTLEVVEDPHFLCPRDFFDRWASGRKQLRMEYFYREMRRREGVLLEADGKPVGGEWNYDAENRGTFGKEGPGELPTPARPEPDALTREVLALVEEHFPDHPGDLDTFGWPVTPAEAEQALTDFLEHRLPRFGEVQDAIWSGEPFLYHSLLSVALNLKLLDPRRAVQAAEEAYREGRAPLASVEGFIRQILGWREYVRGIYQRFMPEYRERNALGAKSSLPAFFWTGETEMACLRDTVGQTLRYGYAHHIQRLMVTGLYALLLGVRPQEVHEWYLAIYVDAVEWVELPNVLGMSQYGDGGVMASKPYAATGKYLQRMSNCCGQCPYDPKKATGPGACPFTTLYWDFLDRNESALRGNQRMGFQLKNLDRKSEGEREEIRQTAEAHRRAVGVSGTGAD